MTKQNEEHISAFMDGELHKSEHAAIIQQICRDDELLIRWQSYHLISDTLRNNLPHAIDNQFAQSVMNALEKEPTVFAPTAMKHKSTVKQKIAGAAIAASVAAVAVIGVQTVNQPKQTAPSLAEMPSAEEYVRMEQLANSATVNSQSPAYSLSPQAANVPAMKASASDSTHSNARITQIYQYHPQLDKYLLNHNQHALGSRVQGVMPYARIVITPGQGMSKETIEQGK